MRILLTGASGFIGAHLAARLSREGHDLSVLPSPHFRPERLRGARYRLVAQAGEARAELVYHLAGPPMRGGIWAAEDERAIVGGAGRLIEELRPSPPARLVMTGSAAEYGSGHGWREEDVPCPDTAFGRLKRAAAGLVRESGIASVHLRVFTPFGEGEAPGRLVPSVARAALAGESLRLGSDGEHTRDYFHILDLIEALVEASRRPLEPGIAINICSGRPRRVIDVARRVAELAGRPASSIEPGTEAADALTLSSGNGERAARLLGWRPRLSLDEGLVRTLAALAPAARQETTTACRR